MGRRGGWMDGMVGEGEVGVCWEGGVALGSWGGSRVSACFFSFLFFSFFNFDLKKRFFCLCLTCEYNTVR